MQNSSKLSFMSFYHKRIKCFTETTTELEKLRKNYPEFHVNTHKSAPPFSPQSTFCIKPTFAPASLSLSWTQHHVQGRPVGTEKSAFVKLLLGTECLTAEAALLKEPQNKAGCCKDTLVINPKGKRK